MTAIGPEKNKKLIKNRLRLAKSLLEESDRLLGAEAYGEFTEDHQLPHERHEREAVVLYLLLTCLDLLGQGIKHLPFQNWINSKKEDHVTQKKDALDKLAKNADHIEAANTLLQRYNEIYGVTNSFHRGLTKLPTGAERYLLSSIKVSPNKNHNFDSTPIEEKQERALKIQYLFKLRNSFTHTLDQHFIASVPMMSAFNNDTPERSGGEVTAAWGVFVQGSHVAPWAINTSSVGAFNYETTDLILKLFEVLHDTVDDTFDRSEIDIRFFIFHLKTNTCTFIKSIHNREIDTYLAEFGLERPRWTISRSMPS